MNERISVLGILALLALNLGACRAPAATHDNGAVREPLPSSAPAVEEITDSSLVGIAALMVRAAPEVSRIWPGFWPANQGFLLLDPVDTALLISLSTPPEVYVPVPAEELPPELEGRAYLRQDYPPEFGENTFRTRYGIGRDTVPALEPRGSTLFNRLAFYYHESFHGFQRPPDFVESPAGDRRVRFREHLVAPDLISSPEFEAKGEVERRILAAALKESSIRDVGRLIRDYLAVRAVRTGELAEVWAVERSFERREGTAEYVGCSAAARTLGASDERVRACVFSELTEPLNSFPDYPEADAPLMRYRQYGTGAAMALLLHRLEVEAWQGRVQRGAYLDALLAEAVQFEPSGARRRVEEALEEFGYEELLRDARGEAEEGESG